MATIEEKVQRGDLLSASDEQTRQAQDGEYNARLKAWLEQQKSLGTIEGKVNAAAFATGTEQPVKIRMHHGAVVSIGRQNALIAIKRGDAELVTE